MDRPTARRDNRSLLLLVGAAVAVFVSSAALFAGSVLAVVVFVLLEAIIAGLWLLAAAGIGAWLVGRFRVATAAPTLSFVTSAATGLGVMSLVVLLLGLVGAMSQAVAVALVVVGLVLCSLRIRRIGEKKRDNGGYSHAHLLWLLVMPIAALAVVAAFLPPGLLWQDEPHGYDVLAYHLQVPREWYESGRIVPLHHNVFSYFPFSVEMHFLLAMYLRGGPWAGMYLAQLMHVCFMGLTVLAVYGFVRERASLPLAILAAAAMAAAPWSTMLGAVAYNEGGLMLFATLAAGWSIRALDGDRRLASMTLAGVFAGFACGSKLTGVPMVLIALPLAWLCVILWKHASPRPVKAALVGVSVYALAGLLTFSPWLVRNLVWTGNPVFPEAASVLGRAHFTQAQVDRWILAHSAAPGQRDLASRLLAVWTQMFHPATGWRFGFVLLPLAIVAVLLERRPAQLMLALTILLMLCFWIGLTHLQGRFFVLAIPWAAIMIGDVKRRYWPIAVGVAVVVMMATTFAMLTPKVAKYQEAVGYEQIQDFAPPPVQPALSSGRPIALVGYAHAFLYQIPMSRLRYRSVFDIDAPPGASAIHAWGAGAPPDAIYVVIPSEARRSALTYAGIPMLEGNATQPYVVERKP